MWILLVFNNKIATVVLVTVVEVVVVVVVVAAAAAAAAVVVFAPSTKVYLNLDGILTEPMPLPEKWHLCIWCFEDVAKRFITIMTFLPSKINMYAI
ncbi:hypothetical protein ElyMa_002223300 [Elysia marginata]|uniref:Secreted protein n=1 Tax=Elysia marginata TaxID=1093978 RepID=A0AAV4FVQ3_9GAST|nr:hypothetical protein ElyMa_002223300 [Elysia marginata]